MTRTMGKPQRRGTVALAFALVFSAVGVAEAASDLQPSIQTSAVTTAIGAPQVYSLALQNHGPDAVPPASASFTFFVPAGGVVLDAHGEYWFCEHSNSQATCQFQPSLPIGHAVPAEVLVLAPTVAGQGWATASAEGPDDGNAANNGGALMTPIVAAANAPDVAVTIDADDVVDAADPFSFDLWVKNVGVQPTSGTLVLRSRLPASLVADSAQGDGWTCSAQSGLVQCNLVNPLAAGQAAGGVTVVAHASGLASPVQLEASVAGSSDVATANNVATHSVAVLPPPMELSAWVDQAPALVGVNEEFGYKIAIRNAGANAMPGPVKVTASLADAEILAAGSIGGWTCEVTDATLAECTRTALGSGEVAVLGLAAKAPAAPGAATLNVVVEPTVGTDPFPDNNSDVASTIVEAPDLSVSLVATPAQVLIGGAMSLKVDVANLSPIAADDAPVFATATLPAGLAFDSVTAPGWNCNANGPSVDCTRASLAGGANANSIVISVHGIVAGTFQPSATVSHAFDFDPGNDNAVQIVRVVTPPNTAPAVPAGQQFVIAENLAPPSIVGTVAATDADGDTLHFSLPQGGQLPFSIDPDTGAVTLQGALDFESVPAYQVAVDVSDGPHLTQATIAIVVSDVGGSDDQVFAPVLPAGQSFVVAENSLAGATFGVVQASDADPEDTLVFTMPNAAALPFAIDAAGTLRVDGALDFESVPSFVVDVEVSDGLSVAAGTVTINVADIGGPDDTNDAPVIAAGQTFSVSEHATPGATIGTLLATDPDPADALSYSLLGDAVLPFTINAATGVLSVDGPLDFETTPSYGGLIVQVSDGSVTVQQGFSIALIDIGGSNDINEPPAIGAGQVFEVSENAVAGSLVGMLAASDPDPNDALLYEFVAPATLPFAINADNGTITVAAALDFESAPLFAGVQVRVHDGSSFVNGTITLRVLDVGGANDVNDAPQIAAGQVFHVNESAVAGTPIGLVQALDPDPGDTLAFALLGDAFLPFTVDAVSGQLRVDGPLDFETQPFYNGLLVQAGDGVATTTQAVTVHVHDFGGPDDVNEAPVIGAGQEFSIPADAPPGTIVGTVEASDADGDALAFHLVDAGLPFAIAPSTGVISVAGLLSLPLYDSVLVGASDGWSIGTQAVRIVVTPAGSGGSDPVAVDDVYFAPADAPFSVAAPGLLANDIDADGGGLLVELAGAPSVPGAIVELQADGGFEFTPPPNASGVTVTFDYRVTDASGDEDIGQVSIVVQGRVFRDGFED